MFSIPLFIISRPALLYQLSLQLGNLLDFLTESSTHIQAYQAQLMTTMTAREASHQQNDPQLYHFIAENVETEVSQRHKIRRIAEDDRVVLFPPPPPQRHLLSVVSRQTPPSLVKSTLLRTPPMAFSPDAISMKLSAVTNSNIGANDGYPSSGNSLPCRTSVLHSPFKGPKITWKKRYKQFLEQSPTGEGDFESVLRDMSRVCHVSNNNTTSATVYNKENVSNPVEHVTRKTGPVAPEFMDPSQDRSVNRQGVKRRIVSPLQPQTRTPNRKQLRRVPLSAKQLFSPREKKLARRVVLFRMSKPLHSVSLETECSTGQWAPAREVHQPGDSTLRPAYSARVSRPVAKPILRYVF